MFKPKYTFTQDWFSQYIPIWKKYLKHLKGKPNLRFLEIGSYEGKSTTWILDNILTHQTSTIICIDPFTGGFEHKDMGVDMQKVEKNFINNIRLTKKSNQVQLIKDYSFRALRTLPLDSFDCVYIDGSHLTKDVISDLILTHPLLKKGGVLICDDYDWEIYTDPLKKPKTAIDFFMNVYRKEYVILLKQQQVFLMKK